MAVWRFCANTVHLCKLGSVMHRPWQTSWHGFTGTRVPGGFGLTWVYCLRTHIVLGETLVDLMHI